MAIFEKAYDPVRQWEGGWSNVEGDRGGETYAGIARNFWPGWPGWKTIDGAKQHTSFRSGARAFSRHLDGIPGLRDMVEDWYRTEWWDRMSLGTLPQTLADELFEQAVNLGRGGAVRSLQRLCNALNYDKSGKRALFPDLAEDGALGNKTLSAMADILKKRSSPEDMVHWLNCLQGAHYVAIAAKNPGNRQFLDGWRTRTYCPGHNEVN